MPPPPRRKRKRPSDQSNLPSPNPADATSTTLSSSLSLPDDASDAPAFLNTTFTTHRASPLYLGPHPLTQPRLHTLSQRLRDLLVGDVVRGIELGSDGDADPTMRRAGALELVSLGWVRLESLLGRHVAEDNDADTSASTIGDGVGGPLGKRRALQVVLQYENTDCLALLLPAVGHSLEESAEESQIAGFLHLPLLLLRMPAPLRAVICGFLSRTFDCRISSLGLGTRSLVGALESWLGETKALSSSAKDVVVTLGFYGLTVMAHPARQMGTVAKANYSANEGRNEGEDEGSGSGSGARAMGIKSIDIIIPHAELRRFVRVGRAYEAAVRVNNGEENFYSLCKRRHLAGDKDEEGWTWRWRHFPLSADAPSSPSPQQQPFTEALALYVRSHLALDLFHPAVRVVKIACSGFVMSEGRVKIFGVPPHQEGEDGPGLVDRGQRAAWAVLQGLGERARVKEVARTLRVVGGGREA